jgi:NAD(P)-dependent dehydrogenase (short-subunit alcohol dehydrogenase family)
MTFEPKDSIIVITGGANGIGKALAIHLANLGAKRIIVVDIHKEAAQYVVDNILPPNVGVAIKADCSVEMDIRNIINRVEFEYGPINAFFANAGILSTGGIHVSNDEWERIWKTNLMQSVYVCRHLIPRFEQRRNGLLVITASAAGLLNMPGALPYAVTKHAAVAFAEWISFTYKSKGIQVACLCPQAVRTDMIRIGNGPLGDTVDAGPAGLDGVLEPDFVAKMTLDSIKQGKFLILPHEKVQKHNMRKVNDYERYLDNMGKISSKFERFATAPPSSRL